MIWFTSQSLLHTVYLSQNALPYVQMTAIKRKGRFQTLSVSSITSKKCYNNYYARTKSGKQHICTSYNSQNMKFRICHDIVVVCEYVRVLVQIPVIQQINTMFFSHIFTQRSSNVNKRHMTILAHTENLR